MILASPLQEEGSCFGNTLAPMQPEDLVDHYERGKLLEELRAHERAAQTLLRSGALETSASVRVAYRRVLLRVIKLREAVKLMHQEDFGHPRAPPMNALQKMYDHHKSLRFSPRALDQIAAQLMPAEISVIRNGRKDVHACGTVALGVLLYDLASPRIQSDQADFWGRSTSWVSQIMKAALDILYAKAVRALRRLPSFHFNKIGMFCRIISQRSAGLLFGHALIDGVGLSVCRPSQTERDQSAYYSGNEKQHVIRCVAIVGLQGMVVGLFGAYPGSASDESIWNLEQLEEWLDPVHTRAQALFQLHRRPKVVGDSGFSPSSNLSTPFELSPNEIDARGTKVFNAILSTIRIPVEWGFGRVVNLWRSLHLSSALKVGWTDPHKKYVVAVMLTNLVVAIEGSQTEGYFGTTAPSLDEYLAFLNGSD